MGAQRGAGTDDAPGIGVKDDVWEPGGDRADVAGVTLEAAAVAPALADFGDGVAEERDAAMGEENLVAEDGADLIDPRLCDIGPDAEDIGVVRDVDPVHLPCATALSLSMPSACSASCS